MSRGSRPEVFWWLLLFVSMCYSYHCTKSSVVWSHLCHFLSPSPPQNKIKKIHHPKNSLYFWKWSFLAVISKKIIFSLNKTFLIFPEMEPCTSQPKSSPLMLLLFFECFHFTNFLYRDCILSGTLFVCCCTASATDLRELFSLSGIFTLHFFPTFDTTSFYQGFPWTSSSALKVAGPLTEVWNPAHLFFWITQCSAKAISRQVLFMY